MYKSIDRMSDYEVQQFIEEATIRLKEAAYARGYKDGFNDAKMLGYFKQPVIEDRKNNEPMQVHESRSEIPNKSEIPNTCGDAISREAAVNAIYDLCGENVSLKENPFRDNPHMDAVIDELENLPSVSPQQKVGRWIETQEPNDVEPFKLWECSRCEQRQRRKSNYCPNCGAKMVEPQESEEQMTREGAIKVLTSLVEVRRKYFDMQTMRDEIEALEIAIEALGQEPILDKIRAEIDEQYDRVHPYDISCAEGLEMALGIIDKYKEESEVEE